MGSIACPERPEERAAQGALVPDWSEWIAAGEKPVGRISSISGPPVVGGPRSAEEVGPVVGTEDVDRRVGDGPEHVGGQRGERGGGGRQIVEGREIPSGDAEQLSALPGDEVAEPRLLDPGQQARHERGDPVSCGPGRR